MEHFLVLGAGSWGTALAVYLARQHNVVLWGHSPQKMHEMQQARSNQSYLPNVLFPPNLQISSDLAQAFQQSGKDPIVLIVVPSHAFDELIQAIQPFLTVGSGVVWGTKGLSQKGEFLDAIFAQNCANFPSAVLSGPSFAQEVARGLPTAVTIASRDARFGKTLVKAFHSDVFRVYLSQDLTGVQLGGTIKNVLAIAVGMSDGLGFGANARCALITRGLAELSRLATKLGAELPTIMGLSGVGDLVLTCTDNQSRNRRFGLLLGQGHDIIEAEKKIKQVVEGKTNAKQVIALAAEHNIEMPICQQVYSVLYERISPQQAVTNLLTRSPKSEIFD